jgi:hypothetical protein
MNDTHEVISAFLDDEPFDPHALGHALSEPDGRTFLIDMVALRCIVQPEETAPVRFPAVRRPSRLRALMAVAAVVVALVGGYVAGQTRSEPKAASAPAPTRIVQGPPAWIRVPSPAGGSAQ